LKSDKMLLWIVVVIALLAVPAVIVDGFRESPQFLNENTPGAVVHDFVLALYKEDFEKAHSYVYSDISFEDFYQRMKMEKEYYQNYGIKIEGSENIDSETAIVEYLVSSGGYGPFDGSYQYYDSATLILDEADGNWKIQHMSPYLYYLEYPGVREVPIVEP